MTDRHSLFYDALLLTLTGLLLRAAGLAFQAYTASLMGAAGVGLLQLILTVGMLAGTVGSSGVRVAAMVLSAREFGHRRLSRVGAAMSACLRYGFFTGTAAGVILYLCADAAAAFWVQDARAALSLRVTAVFLPASVLSSVLGGYFTACGKVRTLVFVQIAERAASVGATLLLFLVRHGAEWLCAAIVAGNGLASVFSLALLYALYRKDRKAFPHPKKREKMTKPLLRLCVPLALGDYLRQGLSCVEQFLIPYGLAKCADRASGMAAYGTVVGMAFPVVMFSAAILWSVADLLVPTLSRCLATGNSKRILVLTDRCFRLGSIYAASVAGTLFVSADLLGVLLYHSQTAGYYIRIFSPMVLFLYLDAVVDGMHKGLGQQVACVRYNTFTNVLDVIGLYTLLPRFGVAGYVFTYAFTHLVNFFLSIRRLLAVTDYQPSVRRLAGLLALLVACAFSSCALPAVFRAPVFLTAFLLLCCRLHLLRREDRVWLRGAIFPKKETKKPQHSPAFCAKKGREREVISWKTTKSLTYTGSTMKQPSSTQRKSTNGTCTRSRSAS